MQSTNQMGPIERKKYTSGKRVGTYFYRNSETNRLVSKQAWEKQQKLQKLPSLPPLPPADESCAPPPPAKKAKKEEPKRWRSRCFWTHYTSCKKSLPKETVIDLIKAQYPAYTTLAIAAEDPGNNLHYHVFAVFKKPFQATRATCTPLQQALHAATHRHYVYRKALEDKKKNPVSVDEWRVEKYRYCLNKVNKGFAESKGSGKGQLWTYTDGVALDSVNEAESVRLSPQLDVLNRFMSGQTLLQQYAEARSEPIDLPRLAYLTSNRDKLRSMLSNMKAFDKELEAAEPQFTKDDFQPEAVQAVEAVPLDKKVIVISGLPDIGKTKLAKTLFKKPLFCSHTDKLKSFDPSTHDAIIFDDCSFGHWPRESVIHLFDVEEERDINVKNSMVTIPAGTPRVFTTNRVLRGRKRDRFDPDGGLIHDKDNSFLPPKLYEADNAVDRRMQHIHFDYDIRKPPARTQGSP